MKPDVGVLVVSWDGYADLWTPFFRCFFRQWSNCPFPVYLGSNSRTFDDSRVNPILIGDEVDYCSNLVTMLEKLPHEWVIPWVEDFLPSAPVDTQRILAIAQYAERNGVDYANLVALGHEISPVFAGPAVVDALGEMPLDAPYRASMGVGLWRRMSLLRLIVPGETAWDFERIGSRRSAELGYRCLCTNLAHAARPPVTVVNGIERGRWTRKAAGLLALGGMEAVVERRGVESRRGVWGMYVYSFARYHLVRIACGLGGAPVRRLVSSVVEQRKLARQN
jgi:hypothetical protein